MKRKLGKLFSVMVSLTMALSLLSGISWAEDDAASDDDTSAADVGDGSNIELRIGLIVFALMGFACAFGKKRKFF